MPTYLVDFGAYAILRVALRLATLGATVTIDCHVECNNGEVLPALLRALLRK